MLTALCQPGPIIPAPARFNLPLEAPWTAGVYAARCYDTGLVKIGSSVRIAERLRTLNSTSRSGEGLNVELIGYLLYEEPRWLEQRIRDQLALDNRRVFHPSNPGLEWCDLDNDEIGRLFRWFADYAKRMAKRRDAGEHYGTGRSPVPMRIVKRLPLERGLVEREPPF